MKLSRRDLFKKIGAVVGMLGIGSILGKKDVYAADKQKVNGKKVIVEWIGHGSFLFTAPSGKKILLDPWISTNPVCPQKYQQDNNFGNIDIVLWTHGHVDHFMMPDAQKIIDQYNPKIIAPWELSFFIKSKIPTADTQTFTLGNKGATADFDGIKITMLEAFHSSGAQLTGFNQPNMFVGEAVGYIIEFQNGLKIYHAGDTSLFSDMKFIIGEYYKPHVAILPIGGVFTMGPDEAAYAVKMIQPDLVIPEHFATFPALEQTTEQFRKSLKKYAPRVQCLELDYGEPAVV